MKSISGFLKALGPGILFAGAAIGGSHLVQSTRAGAGYGTELIWVIIIANLLKYPFFEFGHRYAAATGENIIEGYKKLGTWAVATFFGLSVITSIINAAGVTFVTAALTGYFLKAVVGIHIAPSWITAGILFVLFFILVLGQYPLLDKIVKTLIVCLAIATVTAFIFAAGIEREISPDFIPPELFTSAGIAFLISLMGWMPAPIEASAWTSVWIGERTKQTKYKANLKEVLFDFHVGYIGTAILALFFMGLGAFIMYGTGEEFSNSGIAFSEQLINLYTGTLGNWSLPIISAIAIVTMFSTTITVLDAYPRTLEISLKKLSPMLNEEGNILYWVWILILSFTTIVIVFFFTKGLTSLIDVATIISFLAAPVFAIINYKVVTSKKFPDSAKPSKWLICLSWLGIIYLVAFGILYLLDLISLISW